MLSEASGSHVLSPLVPLERGTTANQYSELSPLAYDETFLMGVVSSRKNNATIHRAQGVIDVFDVCENNASHKL